MKQYAVKTRFVFEGHFLIKAENKMQAREYVEKYCGFVLGGGIHSPLHHDTVDWDFPIHPVKQIGKVTQTQEKMKT